MAEIIIAGENNTQAIVETATPTEVVIGGAIAGPIGPQGNQGIQGIQGIQGTPGSKWYEGAGAPVTAHNDGDYYLNVTTGDVYEQVGGAWGSPAANITGPAGPGATPIYINVKDPLYGAIGDGVHDDTAAIQSAIGSLETAGGGVLFFPAGVYKTTSTLTFTPMNLTSLVKVEGYGAEINYTGSSDAIVINTNIATSDIQHAEKSVHIYGLHILGTSSATSAIRNKASFTSLVDLSIENFTNITSQCAAIIMDASFHFWVEQCNLASIDIRNTGNGICWISRDDVSGVSASCQNNAYTNIHIWVNVINGNGVYGVGLGISGVVQIARSVFSTIIIHPMQNGITCFNLQHCYSSGAVFIAPGVDVWGGTGLTAWNYTYNGTSDILTLIGPTVEGTVGTTYTGGGAFNCIAGGQANPFRVDPSGYLTIAQSNITGAAGAARSLFLQTAGSNRVELQLSALAETGSNAGSNLSVNTYSDAGAYLNTAMQIVRATGGVEIYQGLTVSGGATHKGATSGTTQIIANAVASGVLTLPAATDTLVGRATTDTLTNKTLTTPTIGTYAVISGTSGNLEILSNTDGGDYNIFHSSGTKTLAIYGAGAATLHLNLLDGDLQSAGTTRLTNSGSLQNITDLNITKAAGTDRNIFFNTGTSLRFQIAGATSTAETGSDVGSDFAINSYTDAGAYKATPFFIHRSSSAIDLNGVVTVSGLIRVSAAAATARSLFFQSGGSNRIEIQLSNLAESGSNAGSNLSWNTYNDAGAYLNTAMQIVRSSGTVEIYQGLTVSAYMLSSGATGGLGYTTGAGGTVTQATSKATAVTLNKVTGEITMNAAALAAATVVTFQLNNSALATTDMIVASHHATGTFGAYTINARVSASGVAQISVRNNSAGSLSEAIVIKFAVIKAVAA